jgi:hypothetical protein
LEGMLEVNSASWREKMHLLELLKSV